MFPVKTLPALLLFAYVSSAYAQIDPDVSVPIVNTEQGQVQGVLAVDDEYSYYAYYGIPYAGSVSGENRFKAPTPAPNRNTIFVANDVTTRCMQPSQNGPIGVEDCLTLSIFTNNVQTSRTVFVYLVGEEYTTSNPLEHSFKTLVERDLVVVAINYRLSVFGFLCLGVEEAPGNAGLRDVVQALKWIQSNIAAFGGDPNNIALFGHSSGAAMAELITLSPLANNLVHRVMVHSGSAVAPWAVAFNPIKSAELLLAQISSEDASSLTDLVERLKVESASNLIAAQGQVEFFDNTTPFAPCIDSETLNPDDRFLIDAPITLLESGKYNHIPYISGHTDVEGTLRARQAIDGNWLSGIQNNFQNFVPADLDLDSETTNTIRRRYFGDTPIDMRQLNEFFEYNGDTMIVVPLIRGTVARAQTSTAEVRLLEFSYTGTYNTSWEFPDITLTGVPHGGFLNFLLGFDLRGPNEARVSQSLIYRYVTFSESGVPLATDNGVTWLPMRPTFSQYLEYSGGHSIIDGVWTWRQALMANPSNDAMTFWRDIYANFGILPVPVSSASSVLTSAIILLLCQVILFW